VVESHKPPYKSIPLTGVIPLLKYTLIQIKPLSKYSVENQDSPRKSIYGAVYGEWDRW